MKPSKPSVFQCFIVLCTLWIGACGGGGGNGTTTAPAVSVSVTPPSSTVQAGTTTTLSATVSHDPSSQGVTWTVSCAAAPCGSVSPTTTASGAATTYSAPPSPPAADLSVHIVAAAIAVSLDANAIVIAPTAPDRMLRRDMSELVVIASTAKQSPADCA